MTQGAPLWEPVAVEQDGVVVRMCRPGRADELAQALLRSKAAVSRVFARGQLRRADERGSSSPHEADKPLARTDALAAGEELVLRFHRGEPTRASEQPVELLYHDPILLAVNKPAGLLVHGDGGDADTLTARVQGALLRQGSAAVPQAIQRLDVETTGLVVFSLTEEFQPALDAQVAGHDMRKRYLAVVEGRLDTNGNWRTIDAPMGRDRHDARRMRVSKTGKAAQTRVRTLACGSSETLVLAELQTGRRHQIRVHLAHLGHPIAGDSLYGKRTAPRGPSRLMLHAWQERLVHPVTGALLELEAPVPHAFRHLMP